MNIGLLAVDSNYPNLALMKISSYHKARGDKVGEFPTSEEARKECYRLNGWKYEEPEKRKNNLKY